jgi:hypothetical protein
VIAIHEPDACPHCGASVDAAPAPITQGNELDEPARFDLEMMAALATAEKAYDETVKVRVSQDDIRKLVAKRRKKTQ